MRDKSLRLYLTLSPAEIHWVSAGVLSSAVVSGRLLGRRVRQRRICSTIAGEYPLATGDRSSLPLTIFMNSAPWFCASNGCLSVHSSNNTTPSAHTSLLWLYGCVCESSTQSR